jgi:hypothetical protein
VNNVQSNDIQSSANRVSNGLVQLRHGAGIAAAVEWLR